MSARTLPKPKKQRIVRTPLERLAEKSRVATREKIRHSTLRRVVGDVLGKYMDNKNSRIERVNIKDGTAAMLLSQTASATQQMLRVAVTNSESAGRNSLRPDDIKRVVTSSDAACLLRLPKLTF